eukprot:scaffold462221_cov18-Prasinocladus_malaysianus.AAC.1
MLQESSSPLQRMMMRFKNEDRSGSKHLHDLPTVHVKGAHHIGLSYLQSAALQEIFCQPPNDS